MTNPFRMLADMWDFATYCHQQFTQLNRKVDQLMTDQDKLDADVAALNTALTAVGDEIANLKAQPAAAALDFTGLDSAVSTAQGLAPAPATPADTSVTPPTDVTPPAADATLPPQ